MAQFEERDLIDMVDACDFSSTEVDFGYCLALRSLAESLFSVDSDAYKKAAARVSKMTGEGGCYE